MSIYIYFIAVIMLNQALDTDLVLAGTFATSLIILWRAIIG